MNLHIIIINISIIAYFVISGIYTNTHNKRNKKIQKNCFLQIINFLFFIKVKKKFPFIEGYKLYPVILLMLIFILNFSQNIILNSSFIYAIVIIYGLGIDQFIKKLMSDATSKLSGLLVLFSLVYPIFLMYIITILKEFIVTQKYEIFIIELLLCSYAFYRTIALFLDIVNNLFFQIIYIGAISTLYIGFIGFIFGIVFLRNKDIFKIYKQSEISWLNNGNLTPEKIVDISYKGIQPFFQNDDLLHVYGNKLICYLPYIEEIYGFLFTLIILGLIISKLTSKHTE